MKSFLLFIWHLLTAIITIAKLGGVKALIAENNALRHQLAVMNRGRQRCPVLLPADRLVLGLCSLWFSPKSWHRVAVILKPSTLLKFHKALVKRKYQLFFTANKPAKKSGSKGPSQELIDAVVEMKRRNPRFGCPRIAQQINLAFGLDIDKDVVRRILHQYYKPTSNDSGPSWLIFLGYMKDSLWCVDFFRCESAGLQSYWVMVVMDQFTRRTVGLSTCRGDLDGATIF